MQGPFYVRACLKSAGCGYVIFRPNVSTLYNYIWMPYSWPMFGSCFQNCSFWFLVSTCFDHLFFSNRSCPSLVSWNICGKPLYVMFPDGSGQHFPKPNPLLVGGFEHGFYFPFHIWDVILPIDQLIFFRGVGIAPTRLKRWPPIIQDFLRRSPTLRT